jgi:hypothetical protein
MVDIKKIETILEENLHFKNLIIREGPAEKDKPRSSLNEKISNPQTMKFSPFRVLPQFAPESLDKKTINANLDIIFSNRSMWLSKRK